MKVFVSYSWKNDTPNEKVLQFVNFLRNQGFEAKCDVMYMQGETAISFPEMMAKAFKEAEKVIVVLNKEYKEKADSFRGGVGDEFRYILTDMKEKSCKYIFVSFEKILDGILNSIVPDFVKGREVVDLVKDEQEGYIKLFSKLTGEIQYEFAEVSQEKVNVEKKVLSDFTLFVEEVDEKERDNIGESKVDIDVFDATTTFFSYRVGKAFPGVRGIKWFTNPEEAVQRLAILLRNPLYSKDLTDPIWFFRGSSSLYINKFKILDKDKCLIGVDECLIDKIAVYVGDSYYRSFVYVELKSEPQTGVNSVMTEEQIEYWVKRLGYCSEEYGLYNGIYLSRTEYDDGAAFRNGQHIECDGDAELRVRYLSKYNFIICAKWHPFNSPKGDELTKECLDGLLEGTINMELFCKMSDKLPKHRMDY